MSRSKRADIAKQTIDIVNRGWYALDSVGRVDVRRPIDACLSNTVLYRPEDLEYLGVNRAEVGCDTRFEVNNETTLSAAYRLVVEQGEQRVLVLNFASAKNPGGGFLGGSQAQEESLARSSALYASLQTQPDYYEANRRFNSTLYTDHMILSPDVPVFRDDEGRLLDSPYQVTILTAPAVNASTIRNDDRHARSQIRPTMARRIEIVLGVAAKHGYEHLVLGAWGCGVFRNDPNVIAELFADELTKSGQFRSQFKQVVFAVLDNHKDRIIRPFRRYFEGK